MIFCAVDDRLAPDAKPLTIEDLDMRKNHALHTISFLVIVLIAMFSGTSIAQTAVQDPSLSEPVTQSGSQPAGSQPAGSQPAGSQPVAAPISASADADTSAPASKPLPTRVGAPQGTQAGAKSRKVASGTIRMDCPSGTDKYCDGNNCGCWTQNN
jgi:hypothetical protein